MAYIIGKNTVKTQNSPSIRAFASACGKKEFDGPLSNYFDLVFEDTLLGESTWEKAESKLQYKVAIKALEKANLQNSDVQYVFAGDLLNQCISSTFAMKDLYIPFLGQYGACSTMAQVLIMASCVVELGIAKNALAVTSSHFCSAERQFRFPIEYGGQRTPTAQWTVTGAGGVVISPDLGEVYIDKFIVGKIVDLSIKDITNMGAAMAPAAADTLLTFFKDTNTTPKDYDMIFTGDLGKIGSTLLIKLMSENGINLSFENYNDCGLMIFDFEKQDVNSGGSGCGCSASVLCSYILNKMIDKKFKNVLFIATGALMSPTSSQQGQTIPGIAHLVNFKCKNE